MAITYSLHPNKLKGNEGTYYALVDHKRVVDMEGLIDHMLSRGSSVSKSDILAVYHELQETICHFLEEGYRINTPLVQIYPSIQGKFESYSDSFKKGRHSVAVSVNAGKRLNEFIEETKVRKVLPKFQDPVPQLFFDINSGLSDSKITPGGIGSLRGNHLKLDNADPQQGIYFVNKDGDKFRVQQVVKSTKTEVLFLIPNLAPGAYKLEINRVIKDNKKSGKGILYQALFVE